MGLKERNSRFEFKSNSKKMLLEKFERFTKTKKKLKFFSFYNIHLIKFNFNF